MLIWVAHQSSGIPLDVVLAKKGKREFPLTTSASLTVICTCGVRTPVGLPPSSISQHHTSSPRITTLPRHTLPHVDVPRLGSFSPLLFGQCPLPILLPSFARPGCTSLTEG